MKLNFNTQKEQSFLDPWNGNKEVKVIFAGKCVCCGRNTYQVNEGNGNFEPDPRGQINEKHASASLVAKEYSMEGKDVPVCFECANSRNNYERALNIAKTQFWK